MGHAFYHAACGDFELQNRQAEAAIGHFENALKLPRNQIERQFFENRICQVQPKRANAMTPSDTMSVEEPSMRWSAVRMRRIQKRKHG
jgi:hypothetical protein